MLVKNEYANFRILVFIFLVMKVFQIFFYR